MYNHKLNGYHRGKYYINGKEIELSNEVKDVFEEARKAEQNILRKEKRYGVYLSSNFVENSHTDLDNILSSSDDVQEIVIKNETISLVRQALTELDSDELEIIKLLIDKELTEREISKILGISQVAVNKKKHKVYNKLKKLLKELISVVL